MKKNFIKSVAVILVASFVVSGVFAASKKKEKTLKETELMMIFNCFTVAAAWEISQNLGSTLTLSALVLIHFGLRERSLSILYKTYRSGLC